MKWPIHKLGGLCLICGFILSVSLNAASSEWEILSPKPQAQVKSGELFVALRYKGTLPHEQLRVRIHLDKTDLTQHIKRTGNQVSMLYLDPIKKGMNQLSVHAETISGDSIAPIQWTFMCGTIQESERPDRLDIVASQKSEMRFDLTGRLHVNSLSESVTGGGAFLRQESPYTRTLDLSVEARIHRIRIPVRVFRTSDEETGYQPRNRFTVGIETPFFELSFGDGNPVYHPLIVSGIRVRGIHAVIHLGPVHAYLTQGTVRRGIEGFSSRYNPLDGLPPSVMNPDSTIVTPGTYRRRLTGIRLAFGHSEKVLFGLTALKSTDDSTSIRFGSRPGQNAALGSDLRATFYHGKLHFHAGAAFSVTTLDISGGPASKKDLDSLFQTDLPFDPADYENIIILNTSTVPATIKGLSSLAWYLESRARICGHVLNAAYRTTGASYGSFGVPYLVNDRREMNLSDRFRIAHSKLSFSLKLRLRHDNLADHLLARKTTRSFSMDGSYHPSRNWPRFQLGCRFMLRNTDQDSLKSGHIHDALNTLSFGMNYSLRLLNIRHLLNLYCMWNQREDKNMRTRGYTYSTLTVSVHETFPFPGTLLLQYTSLNMESCGLGMIQSRHLFSSCLQYRMNQGRLVLALKTRSALQEKTSYAAAAVRHGFEISGECLTYHSMHFSIRAGYAYYDETDAIHDYREKYIMAGYHLDLGN